MGSNFGAAWGTWKSGLGVCVMGVDYPKGVIKSILPIVMSGVLGIYGLIAGEILARNITPPNQGFTNYSLFTGYAHLAAGLCCGVSCLAAGGAIGTIGDVGVRGFGLKACNGEKAWMVGKSGDTQEDTTPIVSDAQIQDATNKLYVGNIIMLIFGEALALYGLIVALILSQHEFKCGES